METLFDSDILRYCFDSPAERHDTIQQAAAAIIKPVYAIPVFELCRGLHLLAKFHNISPKAFRKCWTELTEAHSQQGEYVIHVCEYGNDNLPGDVLSLRDRDVTANDDPLYEIDAESYWDRHLHLVKRLRWLHPTEPPRAWWNANPPEGRSIAPELKDRSRGGDIVLDTNNLVDLLNQLPVDGLGADPDRIHFPSRLSENAIAWFKSIIRSFGLHGHFIVPVSALEEADWVANKPENDQKYKCAREVLRSISIDPDKPLWRTFDFEPITQEIFDHFIHLYESLTLQAGDYPEWKEFGDLLVLAHGLYHGCRVASNEWFEGKPDVWHHVKGIFPHLVLA